MIDEVAKQGRSWNEPRSGEGRELRLLLLYAEIDCERKEQSDDLNSPFNKRIEASPCHIARSWYNVRCLDDESLI